ncbi:MAG: SDR family oxidoreductase [Castellaniella sp.]|uniref:SDR family oxidoreductase n=1 Tax=Castellaniella sp. TaxID=1955812 RepID=UPI0012069C7C|nr:SDR family oxidoreductase [Castellaniella sp.]TAN27377.1 MAG: SDR family oxidoreductase [Castellaniella sp.]
MTARRVLVTGASSGIGAAIAGRLQADGWQVTGMDRNPPPHPRTGITDLQVDLADVGALLALRPELAGYDALVHAAGFMATATLEALDHAQGDAMWQVHVRAAEVLASLIAPTMPDGGRIVLIGSRTSDGATSRSQYAATKAALTGLARSWAAELVHRAITVNVVAPAATETPMLHDPARADTPPKLPPMGRYVRRREIAALVAFLLGEDAGAITGQRIVICAGSSL